ncbi:MAG: hypothetical protein ACYTHK_19920 [Planctomycetota bacterium]|jgi:hypothetical protein
MGHDLDRLLGGIPREPAPEIPLESLFERASASRRRVVVLGSVAAAAVLLLAVGFSRPAPEPPVHLDLRVVHVEPEEEAVSLPGQPREFDRP